MTYFDPGWIPDVVGDVDPPTAAWANAIRDRVENRFTTTAERDAAIPSPNAGQLCYITGTNTLQIYAVTGWLSYDLAIQTYTPTLSQGASSNISKTVNESRYVRRWNTCEWWFNITATAAGTAGSEVRLTTPVTGSGLDTATTLGIGLYSDAGTAAYICEILPVAGLANIRMRAYTTGAIVGVNPNIAVANTDALVGHVEFPI